LPFIFSYIYSSGRETSVHPLLPFLFPLEYFVASKKPPFLYVRIVVSISWKRCFVEKVLFLPHTPPSDFFCSTFCTVRLSYLLLFLGFWTREKKGTTVEMGRKQKIKQKPKAEGWGLCGRWGRIGPVHESSEGSLEDARFNL
jgi:hypothetical protein